ncbi:MAG TPA: hypothetical protein VI997_03055 [Candidatus Thermoplasmatota archaeon]|nr:hypothetical protein [Candidatus Thermoplasmatota archaeon]
MMFIPTASAQFGVGAGFEGDGTDFADEPDLSVPDPYTVDPNGVHAAREQDESSAPVLILNAKWMTGDVSEFGATVDLSVLLGPSAGRSRGMLPLVPGEFVAFYGTWTDLNGDGRLMGAAAGQPVFVDADANRDCGSQEVRTDDPSGAFGTPVSFRCVSDVEWRPTAGADVVAYITPGYTTNTFAVGPPPPAPGDPDIVFREIPTADGTRYIAPGDVGAFVFIDNGALETMLMETFVNPTFTPTGVRTREATEGEPTDVDTYTALDPAVETLYKNTVKATLATQGCDPERMTACLDVLPSVSAASTIGPVTSLILPPVERESLTHNFAAAPHTFFDIHIELAQYIALVGGGGDSGAGEVSSDADGSSNAPLLMGVYGNLGAWFDQNGDGWIGAPTADAGCADVYDCGATPEPNDYASSEWTGICRPFVGVEAGRHPYGEINATVTSSTGSWGRGVYVLTDHAFFGLGFGVLTGAEDPDWYYQPGSLAFPGSPYDDIVLDLTDGSIDALVLTGPIPTNLNCAEEIAPGEYRSYDHFVFLDGANVGYDVTVETDVFEADFTDQGVEQIEALYEIDTLPSM